MIRYIQPKDGGFFHEFLKWKFLKFMARYPNLKYRVEAGDSYEVQYDTPAEYKCVQEWNYRAEGNQLLWACEVATELLKAAS